MAKEIVWSDRKRIIFGLPWTFTKYSLTKEKLLVETGIFSKAEEEVRLYRIMDMTLKRSFWQRLFGVGTIHCCTADKTAPELDILWIKDASNVKELLSDMVEAERMEKRVSSREFFSDSDGDLDDDGELDH
ncbi:MAG: PH domain-containing protein [Clostridia bacterium]|nr:PH domain-containing protein [Clostridia bacterium]